MLAGLILAALIAQLALCAAAGAALWWASGVPPIAGAALALGAFFALGAALFGGLREAYALLAVYIWGQLLQPWLAPRDPPRVEPGVLPVLFVHGIYCNAGIWHRQLSSLRRRGFGNLFTINLAPPFGGIDRFAEQLATRAEEVCRAAGTEKLVLVAHSMGGLVARAWIARGGGAARAARLVTLASPHHGSLRTRRAPGRAARDMTPGGGWIARLEADEARAPSVPGVSIFSEHDELVVPPQSARLEGARNVALEGFGHLELLLAPAVHRIVAAEIASARNEPPS